MTLTRFADDTLRPMLLALNDVRTPDIWRCEAGPLLAAACLHVTTAPDEASLPGMAVHGMRRLIKEHGPDWTGADGAVTSMFFAQHLGQALLVLRSGSNLSPDEDALWTSTLVSIAQRLVDTGELRWYANGNIALGNALVMALTWKATGDGVWRDRYEQAFEWCLRPASRWAPRGLVNTTSGAWSQVDGRDQSGYLTEEGSGGVGFDTDYGVLQMSQAARLWVVTRDWKVYRLLNLLWNQVAPLVDDRLTVDMSAGTRHPHPNARWNLTTCAIPVLVAAGRADLEPLLATYWARVADPATWPPTMGPAALYYTGLDLGTALLARAGWTS